MIYLDNAATTLIKPAGVERSAIRAMRTMASPGRGAHYPAAYAAETVYKCREAAAALFNVDGAEQVVFTMNATHALNIAIYTLASPGDRVVVSGFEHNSVMRPLRAMGADADIAGRRLFDDEDMLSAFEKKLTGAKLAVCTHVSNVFGYILPIYEIAELCRKKGVPLIVDASQSAGILELDAARLGAAFIAMPGHKGLFGPQGTGILLCSEGGRPLLHGGSGSDSKSPYMPEYLPDRLEAGTHNVCGIAGLLAGIEYVRQKGTENIRLHERRLLERAAFVLTREEKLELFYASAEKQSGVLSLRCADMDCEELAMRLGERGVCVRSGLHCAPCAHKSAGTIDSGTLRLSFSPFLDESQVTAGCEILIKIINES